MGGGGHCRSPQNRSRRPATSRGSKHRPSQPGTATSEFGASQVSPRPTRCREQPRRRLGESGRRGASRGQRDPVPAGTAFGALGVGRALPFPMSADPGGDRGHLQSAPLGQRHPRCVRSPSFWDDSTRKGPPPPREMVVLPEVTQQWGGRAGAQPQTSTEQALRTWRPLSTVGRQGGRQGVTPPAPLLPARPPPGTPVLLSSASRGRLGRGSEGLRGPVGAIAWVTLARLLGMEEIICERLRAIGPGGETPHGVGAVTREGPGAGAEGPGKREPLEGWHPAGRALSPGGPQLGPNPGGANRWNGPQGPGDKTKGPR